MDSTLRAVAAGQPAAAEVVPHDAMTDTVSVFAAERAVGTDPLGRQPAAALFADLILHKRAETPFCIGVMGAAGTGKSMFLDQVVTATERLAAAASEAGVATPFVADLTVVRVDAAAEGDPETLLGTAIHDRLAATHPALAADLRHAGADPHEAARAASDALSRARRTLEDERQTLEALSGREARLIDTVLETPGASVDTYARAKRSRLERILRQFGFGVADPIATYKNLVREAAEQGGSMPRIGLALRPLYAFRGQTRLIVSAVILALLAWGCAALRSDQARWLASIREVGDKGTPAADWLQAHVGWLGPAESLLLMLAVLLLLLCVARAARFVLPIARGVDLLQQDLDSRRRDLSGQIAHQTRRVDALTTEAAAAAQRAASAERRAGGPVSEVIPSDAGAGVASRPAETRAAAFFRALGAAMAPLGSSGPPAPTRILVAIDGLDEPTSDRAVRILTAARRLFGAGIVTIAGASPSHLMAGFGETDPARAAAQFARCIQVPYQIAGTALDGTQRTYAMSLIGGMAAEPEPAPAEPDARQSALDRPWRPREAETVVALAPFAGETPRAVKRFVNLYRIARADPRLADAAPPVFTALALALALDAQGLPGDLTALEQASHGEAPAESGVLRKALAAAREASGTMVELGQAQRALDVVESYTSRP